MRVVLLISISILFSCNNSSKKNDTIKEKTPGAKVVKIEKKDTTQSENISYFEFKPDTIANLKLLDYDLEAAYQLDSKKIVTGYDQRANPDSDKNWGDKLLLLNNKNDILFKSFGVGDVYLFEPHFYKNKKTDSIIIICQKAYEYNFGGEAFLLKNDEIEYIGTLDIESSIEEKSLTDIIEINERDNQIIFTFDADSLYLKPGSEDMLIKNTGVSYIYENKELTLKK